MGNYVIAGVGNYVIENPSDLGNFMIADTCTSGACHCASAIGLAGLSRTGLGGARVVPRLRLLKIKGGSAARPNRGRRGGIPLRRHRAGTVRKDTR